MNWGINMNMWMKAAALAATLLAAGQAQAATNLITNGSFETLPGGGLPVACGLGCSFSQNGGIPGWNGLRPFTGQYQPGSALGNVSEFDYVPDGLTVAYTQFGIFNQITSALGVAGVTYTLSVDLGDAKSQIFTRNRSNQIYLSIGSGGGYATGGVPADGGWTTYTYSHTVTAAEAGNPFYIQIADNNDATYYDNITLFAAPLGAVPEPASWTMMIIGFGAVGSAMRRRSKARGRSFA
jgi:PEP-CTERM motif